MEPLTVILIVLVLALVVSMVWSLRGLPSQVRAALEAIAAAWRNRRGD